MSALLNTVLRLRPWDPNFWACSHPSVYLASLTYTKSKYCWFSRRKRPCCSLANAPAICCVSVDVSTAVRNTLKSRFRTSPVLTISVPILTRQLIGSSGHMLRALLATFRTGLLSSIPPSQGTAPSSNLTPLKYKGAF